MSKRKKTTQQRVPADLTFPEPVAETTAAQRKDSETLAFEGAQSSRAVGRWNAPRTDADSEINAGAVTLVARSRDAVRNYGLARRGLWQIALHLVGTGIRPIGADARLMKAWKAWAKRPTSESRLSVYGLQLQAALAMLESGESLLRRRARRPADGLPVPMQVQLLESDFLDETITAEQAGGGVIVQGIEFDALGTLKAYHLRRAHPGALGGFGYGGETVRVPEADIAHIYAEALSRPGQTRGIPHLTPTLLRLRQMVDYRTSEAARKRSASAIWAIVTGAASVAAGTGDPQPITGSRITDAEGRPVETLRPNSVYYAPEGLTVSYPQPPSDQAYPAYMQEELREIAAEIGIPYELLTGDLSGTNYSSIRYGMLAFKRWVDVLRETVVVPLLCDRLWEWFVEAAVVAEVVPAGDYPVEWSRPAWSGGTDGGRRREGGEGRRGAYPRWPVDAGARAEQPRRRPARAA